MELRVEVANAAGLLARINAAVSLGKMPGWWRSGDRLITTVDGIDVVFETRVDVLASHPPHPPMQQLICRATGAAETAKLSDAITRLEVAIRNRFVTPRPEAEPIDDYGVVNAEFVIRE